MDNKTFQDLLKKGELGLILMDGGADLTPLQMKQVKSLSKELSDAKINQMAVELAGTPGYREFMSMPLMAQLLGGKKPKQNANQPNVSQETQSDKVEEQKPAKTEVKRESKYTKIPAGEVRPLKVGDSISDVMAKMTNFMFKQYIKDTKRLNIERKHNNKLINLKEKRIAELISLFGGKYKAKVVKEEKSTFMSKLLNMIIIGTGLFLLSKKAIASVDLQPLFPKIPSFTNILRKLVGLPEVTENGTEIEKLEKTFLGTSVGEGKINIVKSKEIYDYLIKEKGVSHEQAIGMLANIQAESSFNAGALGDYKNGVATSGGLFQHHGPRFKEMRNFVGPDWANDWKKQIDFALSEEAGRRFVAKEFKTPEEASLEFTRKFEIPKDTEIQAQKRLKSIPSLEKSVALPTPEQKTTLSPTGANTTEIPNQVKKINKKESSSSFINNNNNVFNGGTNYNITETTLTNYPVIIDKQYITYG